MTRFSGRFTVAVIVALAAFSPSQAQQNSSDEPLGDVAREQKKIHKEQTNAGPQKVYTNAEVVTSANGDEVKPASQPAATSEACSKDKAAEPAKDAAIREKKSTQPDADKPKSVFDRPKDTAPDMIFVPAATEIRVDVPQRKVVLPVRIGFSTPIPALSKVALEIRRTYVNNEYVAGGLPYDYVDYATVTAIVIEGTSYTVHTDAMPLLRGDSATNSEVTFHLSAPLPIPR
jgi:hypothetical protein